jgi:hypothetical protein
MSYTRSTRAAGMGRTTMPGTRLFVTWETVMRRSASVLTSEPPAPLRKPTRQAGTKGSTCG